MLIDQLDVLLRGEATTTTYITSVLNSCVPFVVSNLGLLAGHRTSRWRPSRPWTAERGPRFT